MTPLVLNTLPLSFLVPFHPPLLYKITQLHTIPDTYHLSSLKAWNVLIKRFRWCLQKMH